MKRYINKNLFHELQWKKLLLRSYKMTTPRNYVHASNRPEDIMIYGIDNCKKVLEAMLKKTINYDTPPEILKLMNEAFDEYWEIALDMCPEIYKEVIPQGSLCNDFKTFTKYH